jgi:hypothetical protein
VALCSLLALLTCRLDICLAADEQTNQASQPRAEVVIGAKRYDKHTLEHDIVPRFVQSHGAPSIVIDQVSKWRDRICPQATGLQSTPAQFVSYRILSVARGVGAPTRDSSEKCTINVEIVFTPTPQELLEHIAKSYPILLGSSRSKNDTQLRRAVQAWYLTGTRSMNGYQPPHPMQIGSALADPMAASVLIGGRLIDPPDGLGAGVMAPSGTAGSHLQKGLTSEIVHVFVVVDSSKVGTYSLQAVADYIAMISLTRISSLDNCNELPSVVDLLSSGCEGRAKPGSITTADTAFLQALYGSNLEKNLNVEVAEMRDQMAAMVEANR